MNIPPEVYDNEDPEVVAHLCDWAYWDHRVTYLSWCLALHRELRGTSLPSRSGQAPQPPSPTHKAGRRGGEQMN